MKVLGRDKLIAFAQRHANAKKALDVWFYEASKAAWHSPQDIKANYRSVDFWQTTALFLISKAITTA